MDNSQKIILDLCGGTGSWSKPYRDAGYDVRVITMPRFDVTKFEYNDETAELIFRSTIGNDMVVYAPHVYGILAAPPCTMFSIARTVAKQPRDLRGSMAIVNACKKIVEHVMIATDMKMGFWAIENPRGHLRKFLGIPKNTYFQWQFGGQHKKPSDFWGYYNPPRPFVTVEPKFDVDKSWQKPVCPPEYLHLKLDRAGIRSITPAGFAQAFFKANP